MFSVPEKFLLSEIEKSGIIEQQLLNYKFGIV